MKYLDLVRAEVEKPARYAGAEFFPEGYRSPAEGDLRFAIAYPDLYEVGMSNTGIRILYSILRRIPNTYTDLIFAPWADMEAYLRKTNLPLESRHGHINASQFDIIGFSLQYELTYTNILNMLDLAGIPLRSKQRVDGCPLIIAGGPGATHPEAIAPFIDAFVLGDGEEIISELTDAVRRTRGQPRAKVLEALSGLEGVYVPLLHETSVEQGGRFQTVSGRVKRRVVGDLDAFLPFASFPVPALETVFDRLSLELARGCAGSCRFCEAGYTYRPVRERSVDNLLAWVSDVVRTTGIDEVSLASLSTADYTNLESLVQRVQEASAQHDIGFTVSSLRAHGLPESVLEFLAGRRSSSLTLAPEAGTQRLRDVINKNITKEQLLEAVYRTTSWGWNRLKYYFMLGLPTETTTDIEGIQDLVSSSYSILRGKFGRRAELSVACSLFVPRPHTPFQWEPMLSREELGDKVRQVKRLLFQRGVEVRWHNPSMSQLEGIVARGDRRVADVIERAWVLGARFDSWEECFDARLWDRAMDECGVNERLFLDEIAPQEATPWDHVDVGVSRDYLWSELQRAKSGETTTPCTPVAGDPFVCHACGIRCKPPLADVRTPASANAVQSPQALPGDERPEETNEPKAVGRPSGRQNERKARMSDPSTQCRLLVRWSKAGDVCLLGHLDMQRHWLLALRRAGLRLGLSQGFHPRPKVVFTPALPLGFLGLDEHMDVLLARPPVQVEGVEPDDLRNQITRDLLAGAGLPGVTVLEAKLVSVAEPTPDLGRPTGMQYVVALANEEDCLRVLDWAGNPPQFCRGATRAQPQDWWPEPGHGVVLEWEFVNAPRVDRTLRQALPDLKIAWVARTRVYLG